MDVQFEKEQLNPVEWAIKVTVPAETMADRIKTEMDKIVGTITLPGFRPGHVPRKVVVDRFGTAVIQEVLQEVLQESYRTALEQSGLEPVSPGEMSDIQFSEGNALTFTVGVEIAPEVDMPNLAEITVEKQEPTVGDEDVMRTLDELRESHAVVVPTDDPVSKESVITVDLQELDDSGVAVIGRAQRGIQVDLTHHHLGEEFEARVMGLACDQTTTVEFPMRVGEEETKTVRYQVEIKNIQRKEMPALDDELARSVNPQITSLDDLKSDIQRYLQARASHEARERMYKAAVDEMLKQSQFTIPPRMLDDYLNRMAEDAIQRSKQGKKNAKIDESEVEKFKEDYRASAIWNMRWFMMRKKLVDERGLEITDDEYTAELERLAQIEGDSREDLEKRLTSEQVHRVRDDLLERKVLAVITSEIQTVPRPVTMAEFEGRTAGHVHTV